MSDGSRLNERINALLERTRKIGDTLHGPNPRDVPPSGGAKIEPVPTLRRYLDSAHSMVGDIENELSRIEGRI